MECEFKFGLIIFKKKLCEDNLNDSDNVFSETIDSDLYISYKLYKSQIVCSFSSSLVKIVSL